MSDKWKHFCVCFAVTAAGCLLGHPWYGVGAAILAGVGKEAWDTVRPKGTGWDWWDLCADAVGVGVALILFGWVR